MSSAENALELITYPLRTVFADALKTGYQGRSGALQAFIEFLDALDETTLRKLEQDSNAFCQDRHNPFIKLLAESVLESDSEVDSSEALNAVSRARQQQTINTSGNGKNNPHSTQPEPESEANFTTRLFDEVKNEKLTRFCHDQVNFLLLKIERQEPELTPLTLPKLCDFFMSTTLPVLYHTLFKDNLLHPDLLKTRPHARKIMEICTYIPEFNEQLIKIQGDILSGGAFLFSQAMAQCCKDLPPEEYFRKHLYFSLITVSRISMFPSDKMEGAENFKDEFLKCTREYMPKCLEKRTNTLLEELANSYKDIIVKPQHDTGNMRLLIILLHIRFIQQTAQHQNNIEEGSDASNTTMSTLLDIVESKLKNSPIQNIVLQYLRQPFHLKHIIQDKMSFGFQNISNNEPIKFMLEQIKLVRSNFSIQGQFSASDASGYQIPTSLPELISVILKFQITPLLKKLPDRLILSELLSHFSDVIDFSLPIDAEKIITEEKSLELEHSEEKRPSTSLVETSLVKFTLEEQYNILATVCDIYIEYASAITPHLGENKDIIKPVFKKIIKLLCLPALNNKKRAQFIENFYGILFLQKEVNPHEAFSAQHYKNSIQEFKDLLFDVITHVVTTVVTPENNRDVISFIELLKLYFHDSEGSTHYGMPIILDIYDIIMLPILRRHTPSENSVQNTSLLLKAQSYLRQQNDLPTSHNVHTIPELKKQMLYLIMLSLGAPTDIEDIKPPPTSFTTIFEKLINLLDTPSKEQETYLIPLSNPLAFVLQLFSEAYQSNDNPDRDDSKTLKEVQCIFFEIPLIFIDNHEEKADENEHIIHKDYTKEQKIMVKSITPIMTYLCQTCQINIVYQLIQLLEIHAPKIEDIHKIVYKELRSHFGGKWKTDHAISKIVHSSYLEEAKKIIKTLAPESLEITKGVKRPMLIKRNSETIQVSAPLGQNTIFKLKLW